MYLGTRKVASYNDAPVLAPCPANQTTVTNPGQATALITWEGPVATDNSGDIPTVTCSPPSGTNLTIGRTTVKCTAVDVSGNQDSCSFYANVIDNEDPVLAPCPANQTTVTNPGQATALITWEGPVATDNSGDIPTVTCYPPSGTNLTIGRTNVTCMAVDVSGNKESCSFYTNVIDNEDPVLAPCPANQTTVTNPGQATALIIWEGPVATDNSGNIPTVTCFPPSRNNFPIGRTNVTCMAVDVSGNQESCSFYANVIDNEAPSLAHCPDQAINRSHGSPTSVTGWKEPMATDNSGHSLTVTCDPPSGTGNFSNGQKHVICTAVDEYGNQDSCSFYVIDNCLHQLGMEDGRIENGQITASSSWRNSASHGPRNARLNHQRGTTTGGPYFAGAWIAAINDVNQWIQVNLRAVMWVSGVMIQGRDGYDRWVTKFKVQYKTYGVDWQYVQTLNKQEDMVFDGNNDEDTVVTKPFPSPVRATVIRIQPMQWHGRISLRFDLIGCEDPEWHLIFKAVSSTASAPMNTTNGLDEYDPFQVWKTSESLNENIHEAHKLNAKYKGHYKSSFARDWAILNIDKVGSGSH
ncbi:hyalin-like [Amphiura filiformis]|uniref:hyalin-like n=1 Tax=Amphiura filiformis TaxID=82378 RepID=UPI003B21656F